MLYRTPNLSPDKTDVAIGTAVMLAVEIGLPVLVITSGSGLILLPFVLLPLPVLMLLLAAFRLLKGHGSWCSLRWAYVVLAGLGRFLSF